MKINEVVITQIQLPTFKYLFSNTYLITGLYESSLMFF